MDYWINQFIGLTVGIIGSLIATFIYLKSGERRQRKIRQKIESLDFEEKFLEKISKGNVGLLRSSFKVLFIYLGISGWSAGVILISYAINAPPFITLYVQIIGTVLLLVAGSLAFAHAKTLVNLDDLINTKRKIEEKRIGLHQKLK
jgi:hypothetical protein